MDRSDDNSVGRAGNNIAEVASRGGQEEKKNDSLLSYEEGGSPDQEERGNEHEQEVTTDLGSNENSASTTNTSNGVPHGHNLEGEAGGPLDAMLSEPQEAAPQEGGSQHQMPNSDIEHGGQDVNVGDDDGDDDGDVPGELPRRQSTTTGTAATSGLTRSAYFESRTFSDTVYCTNRTGRSSRRGSSLELRQLPENVLLKPEDVDLFGDLSVDEEQNTVEEEGHSGFLQKTCLNSKFSLRTQMMLSFGIISAFTILFVVVVCIVVTLTSSALVKEKTRDSFEEWAVGVDGWTARLISEQLTPKLVLEDVLQIMHAATRDRFAGYPDFEDDSGVPFFDIISQSNKYPLVGPPLPLDWQLIGNVNDSNFEEHFQDRWPFYRFYSKVSTASAVFYMQGMCDPDETNSSHYTFFQDCTDANNNITTGGVFAPSPTTQQVHRKASDLVPLLKALHEYNQDIKTIGIYSSNSGAGASVVYPGLPLDTIGRYISIGCDWARVRNPYNSSRNILSDDEVSRCRAGNIHVYGESVSSRLYNPADRGWFRDMALNHDKTVTIGPYPDAWADGWAISQGRAVFDRITNEFLGCVLIDFVLDTVAEILMGSKPTNNSHVSITHWDSQGSVLASTSWNMSTASESVRISELYVGLDGDNFKKLYELADYSANWDPRVVREAYEEFAFESDGFRIKGYPMPPPPAEYDPTYEPMFLVVVSIFLDDLLRDVDSLDRKVDKRVENMLLVAALAGCIGFAFVMAVVVLVAYCITLPLKGMNEVAGGIIENFGGNEQKIEVKDLDAHAFLKTELSEIVQQFQRMVMKFSGGTIAKSAKYDILELDNQFRMFNEFENLYMSRQQDGFKYILDNATSTAETGNEKEEPEPLTRVHLGSNVVSDNSFSQPESVRSAELLKSADSKGCSSPLFRWIVVLIIFPLLLSTVTISAFMTAGVSYELPNMISDATAWRIVLLKHGLEQFTMFKVGLVARSSEQSIRDLHILTRYTTWLLFGGLNLSDAYPALLSGTEECKKSPSIEECEYAQQNFVCDCAWDRYNPQCVNYDLDSRYLQLPFFVASSQDAWPNGDRNSTSYPRVAYAPNATAWWENATVVPGSTHWNGSNTGSWTPLRAAATYGHASTYDRLRSVAALPVHQILYNYDADRDVVINSLVSFEADGLHQGYMGCGTIEHVENSAWVSSTENRGEELRPELCPVGKYGYDPRCRPWYDRGKSLSNSGESSLYVTPPYLFASQDTRTVAQSCTAPLVDPGTGEYVGQTLIDFFPTKIIDGLNQKNLPLLNGFPILITMEKDSSKADAVFGPNFSPSDVSRRLEEVLFPSSLEDCDGEHIPDLMNNFVDIADAMRSGMQGIDQFEWTSGDCTTETMYISYSPVEVDRLRPLNSSDFARGVERTKYAIYSLAMVESESSMLAPLRKTEEDIQRRVDIAIAILCIVVVFAACFIVYLSHRITVSMVEPMYYLLELIKHINRLNVGEEAPGVYIGRGYGSKEVLRVRCTMEKLFKIIQCANVVFFAGEIDVAYRVFLDALYLFTRLDNKKAMGVANNNLGNTMLTLYRTMKDTGDIKACGFTVRQIIGKGMAYFRQSIQLGETAYETFYDAEGWSPACLNFMQHLSNRYFNRAMFLLTVKNDHERPLEIDELGKRDLEIARDMDVEIVEEGSQAGWGIFRAAPAHFEVLISRIRGHLTLLEMGYPDDWGVDEMLDDAFDLLQKELKGDSNDLFNDLSPAGRMQQIETELMRYYMLKGETETSAKIAIRMLIEDEFTLPEAQEKAVEVLIKYVASREGGDPSISMKLVDYQKWLGEAFEELDTVRSSKPDFDRGQLEKVLSSASLKESSSEHPSAGGTKPGLGRSGSSSLRQSLRGDITMETF